MKLNLCNLSVHGQQMLSHQYHQLNCQINEITSLGANSLLQAKCNTFLNSLNIDSRTIGDRGAIAVSSCLQESSHLESLHALNLPNNSIGNDGMAELSDSLKNCINVASLILSHNSISVNGIKSLANILLKSSKNLTLLDLSHNFIGCSGIKGISCDLKKCINLTSLNLAFNSIDDISAITLACHALKYCTSLISLDLSGNVISSHGATAIFDALKKHASLTTLNYSTKKV